MIETMTKRKIAAALCNFAVDVIITAAVVSLCRKVIDKINGNS